MNITQVNGGNAVTPGTSILVEGTGFGVQSGSNLVLVGSAIAELESWSDTQISIKIPYGVDDYPDLRVWDSATGDTVSNLVALTAANDYVASAYTTSASLQGIKSGVDWTQYTPLQIQALIEDVSAEIDSECSRPYGLMRQTVHEDVIGRGIDVLMLRNYCGRELRSWAFNVKEILVQSAYTLPGIYAFKIDPNNIFVDPTKAMLCVKNSFGLKAIDHSFSDIPWRDTFAEGSIIRVTYESGYGIIPSDVKRACEMLAIRRATQGSLNFVGEGPKKIQVSKIEIELEHLSSGSRKGIADEIKDLIEGYRLRAGI